MFIDGEYVLERRRLGAELQALAPAFVSKRTGRAFLGYLDAQRRGLIGERHATRTRELSSEHGYDTKYAMRALRIGHQGYELVTSGRITLPVPEPTRSRLMDVRRGEVPLPDVLTELHDVSARLEEVVVSSDLPEQPDHATIDAFLISACERAWANEA